MAHMPTEAEMLQRYRRDRKELLEFVLTSNALKKVVLPPGAVSIDDVDLHEVSVDYVLHSCRKGIPLDLAEAIRLHHEDIALPAAGSNGLSDVYYLVTDPSLSGPAPNRKPPPQLTHIPTVSFKSLTSPQTPQPYFSAQSFEGPRADLETSVSEEEVEEPSEEEEASSEKKPDESSFLLPSFTSGLCEDDLRACAYELLLACVAAAGGQLVPTVEEEEEKEKERERDQEREKEKEKEKEKAKEKEKTRNTLSLFSKKERERVKEREREKERERDMARERERKSRPAPEQRPLGLSGLLQVLRIQLNVPEALNKVMWEVLFRVNAEQGHALLVPLELLCSISPTHFTDRKTYTRWCKRQLNLLREGLLHHPFVPLDDSTRLAADLEVCISNFEFAESGGQRVEALRGLREAAMAVACRGGGGGGGGALHWADGYHLNVSLYSELAQACCERGPLREEGEGVQELLKATWHTLGITPAVHAVVYAGVLFRQFTISGEERLLQEAAEQVQLIPSEGQPWGLTTLVSSLEGQRRLSLLRSFLGPAKQWADCRLRDYHRFFPQGATGRMEQLLLAAMAIDCLFAAEDEQSQMRRVSSGLWEVWQQSRSEDREEGSCVPYIQSSISAAFERCAQSAEERSEAQQSHPLALLAADVTELMRKEVDLYSPLLLTYNKLSLEIAASLVHRLYGQRLRPFLGGLAVLTEEARAALAAGGRLEALLLRLAGDPPEGDLPRYQVAEATGNIAMRWVSSQVAVMGEWIDRSFTAEKWEVVSQTHRYGHSVVDTFRIIEDTLEHFFDLGVPIRLTLMKALATGIDSCLHHYVTRLMNQLGPKAELTPPAPPLTRFKVDVAQRAAARARNPARPLVEARTADVSALTTRGLCVRLNTLQFMAEQMAALEDGIRERWQAKRAVEETLQRRSVKGDELAGALDLSRRAVSAAIDKACDFTGTKIVFWDLREPFLEKLYSVNVASARIGPVLDRLDPVLGELCEVITEHLRDRVVLGLLQACLDGLHRVLLDGGPARAFAKDDAEMLEDDVHALKDFFIAGGDGLPRTVVENTAAPVQQILNLYSLETSTLIDCFNQASGVSAGPTAARPRMATDSETLLRVLCHRADRDASKFLKKHFRLPKVVT